MRLFSDERIGAQNGSIIANLSHSGSGWSATATSICMANKVCGMSFETSVHKLI